MAIPIIKPPFTMETALVKVKAAEDAWNTRDPEQISLAYAVDTEWRDRTQFLKGCEEVKKFLERKWAKNSITGSSKSCRVFELTGWRCVLNTNGAIRAETGFAPTATSFRNSTRTA
jgi:nuclear transport factor 2 (NTF2) superfamily protein